MIRYERDGEALVATARVPMGAGEITLAVPLGTWGDEDPSPGGLLGRPVVVVPDASLVPLAAAGVRRSGRLEPQSIELASQGFGGRLLSSSAEVDLVVGSEGGTLGDIRALGGRPIPALPFPDADAIRRFIEACPVEVDLVVPAIEPARRSGRSLVLDLGLEAIHHVVEVDPRPAFAELGAEAGRAQPAELAAGAAGVLAGRIAAEQCRWRSVT